MNVADKLSWISLASHKIRRVRRWITLVIFTGVSNTNPYFFTTQVAGELEHILSTQATPSVLAYLRSEDFELQLAAKIASVYWARDAFKKIVSAEEPTYQYLACIRSWAAMQLIEEFPEMQKHVPVRYRIQADLPFVSVTSQVVQVSPDLAG